ncbi:TPA: hypothetical protein ACI4AV_003784 [Proteus mirabilis]
MEIKTIDELFIKIKNYYFKKLEENNYTIFTYNKNINYKKYRPALKELNAFVNHFDFYFITKSKLRKTKHIKSNEFLKLYNRQSHSDYFVYFYLNKDEYDYYLIDFDFIYFYFKTEIDFKINENKGFYD